MRREYLLSAAFALSCACSATRSVSTVDALLLRARATDGGGRRWHCLVFLPREEAYCHVVWALAHPISIGSNASIPVALGNRGDLEAALAEFHAGHAREPHVIRETTRIPADVAREIVHLADSRGDKREDRHQLAMAWFDLGLFPGMMDLDLDNLGRSAR
jgi:hypothetical protein